VEYLVLIPSDGQPLEIRYRELTSPRELRDGDQVILDDLRLRVRAVLDPSDADHDGTLVCRPEEPC